MVNCAVSSCKRRSATSNLRNHGISYHMFPKDPVLREKWKIFCGHIENWTPTHTSVICSEHFTADSFEALSNNRRKLIEGAIPTLISIQCNEEPPAKKRRIATATRTALDKATEITPSPQLSTETHNVVVTCSQTNTQTSTLSRPIPQPSTSHRQSFVQSSTSYSQSVLQSSSSLSRAIPQTSTSHSQSISQQSTSYNQFVPQPSTSHSQPDHQPSTSNSQSIANPSTTITSITELIETPRKRKMRKQLQFKNKKIRRLQAKNRYLKKKVNTLQELLNNLEEKNLIDKEDKIVLSKIGVTEKELLKREMMKSDNKLPRTKYSSELRSFALTLHYYSAKAYKYVRKVFQTCLPHPRTLSKWYSCIDGQPGFTKESLYALKLRAEQEKTKIYCALVFDEMKIKLYPEWDPRTRRYFGYVNHGFETISDSSDKATDALVLLLVGINKIFRVPIAYFLVKGTTGVQKSRLVLEALSLVHETGIEIKSLTCDGVKANFAMAEELGCCLDPDNLQTSFLDPSSGQKVSFFADPCHMLKLIRNTFSDYEYLINNSEEQIKFEYIKRLHDLQEKELFYLANKLRANHVYYKTKIMNVKLATQLFSASVADSLLFCKNNLNISAFDNVEPTANFIKLMNDVFDILDSRTKSYGFKRALSKDNYQAAFNRLQEARQVILQLNVDLEVKGKSKMVQKSILKSPRYTGFLGLLICIESTQILFQDLVLSDKLKYLSMHKISQDHIEIFFSVIRSHGGYNDNPTARQFEAIYKKLLIHTELQTTSTGTNCIPLEKLTILNCTSAIEKINKTVILRGDEDELRSQITIAQSNEDIIEDIESQIFISPFGEKVIEYIAGFSAFSISKKIKCATCLKGLLGPINKGSLIYHKSRGYLVYASQPVIDLCRICEKEIRKNLNDKNQLNTKVTTQFIISNSLKYFVGKDLFPNIEYHSYDNGLVNHTLELANVIMEKYTNVRLSFLTKKVDPQKCVRHVYNKLVHFKNQ